MTISRRSWRCLSRRALARISIIVMLGESSMNIGAEETSPILRASLSQSSSLMLPLRMWFSGTFASADSSRMVISVRVISRLKKTAGQVVVDRRRPAQVEGQRRLPHRGSRRDDDHLPGVQPVGQVVEVGEAGGHAVEAGLAVADRLDLVEDAVHDVGQRRVVLGRAPVGDLVDLGLRPVDHVVDLRPRRRTRSGRSWCRRRPAGAGSPSRGRSRRSSRRWRRSARWPRACGGTARRRPGPARRGAAARPTTVTGSAGSPRP